MNTSIDFAKMLEDSIDDKINQSREEMREYQSELILRSFLAIEFPNERMTKGDNDNKFG
jgi:hypothetical protein